MTTPFANLPQEVQNQALYIASEFERAFPSDPFIRGRILNQIRNVPHLLSEFSLEWRNERRSYIRDREEIFYTVLIPCNVKMPTS